MDAEAPRAQCLRGMYRGVGHRVLEARPPAARGNRFLQASQTKKLGQMQGTSRATVKKKDRAKYVVAGLPASGVEGPATCAGLFILLLPYQTGSIPTRRARKSRYLIGSFWVPVSRTRNT